MWPELPIHTSNKGQNHEEDDGDDDSYKVPGERYFQLLQCWQNHLGPLLEMCVCEQISTEIPKTSPHLDDKKKYPANIKNLAATLII